MRVLLKTIKTVSCLSNETNESKVERLGGSQSDINTESEQPSKVDKEKKSETYSADSMPNKPQGDQPIVKDLEKDIDTLPSISSDEAKKYQKKVEEIWRKHRYGFANFHYFEDVVDQLKVYVGKDIAKFLNLSDQSKLKVLIAKENPKKTIDLSIGNEKFSLRFGDITNSVPTIYSFKDKEDEEHFFSGTDIEKLTVDSSKKNSS